LARTNKGGTSHTETGEKNLWDSIVGVQKWRKACDGEREEFKMRRKESSGRKGSERNLSKINTDWVVLCHKKDDGRRRGRYPHSRKRGIPRKPGGANFLKTGKITGSAHHKF